MSDKMRWRYGDTNPVVAAVKAETVIEIGDLLWLHADNAKPASLFPYQTVARNESNMVKLPDLGLSDARKTQMLFASKFLGVAMTRSRSGDKEPIRVATTGVFEFDCPNRTFELGDLVGAAVAAGDGGLLNQRVNLALLGIYAVGRVDKFAHTPIDIVLVNIRSTVMTGGVNGSSPASV